MNSKFNYKRALSIAKKERFHILRDPFTLTMATILPVLLVLIFGLAIEFNVKDIGLTVHDSDRSLTSRKLAEVFSSSQYFKIKPSRGSLIEAISDLDSENSKASLIKEIILKARMKEASDAESGQLLCSVFPTL